MRCVDPESLTVIEQPDPVPGPGEVLIRVTAAGVNRADLQQRAGKYPPPKGASEILGLECSGVVEALGPGVEADGAARAERGWGVGSQVVALLAGGGYAELVAVPASQVLPADPILGEHLDLVAAGGLVEAAATAYANMVMAAGLRPAVGAERPTVLVQGGSGGVGHIAIQLARAYGARVLTTAGSANRLERCEELGAEVAINHRGDVPAAVSRATGGRGVDLILDVRGGPAIGENVSMLAMDGTLSVISFQEGRTGELDLTKLAAKRGHIVATFLRARTPQEKGEVLAGLREYVWPLVASGSITTHVDLRIHASRAARAHELLEDGSIFGKAVLTF